MSPSPSPKPEPKPTNLRDRLKRWLKWKDLGYEDLGEEFTRYTLLKTPWFNVYLHRLYCPYNLAFCHDHPWWFLAFILTGGYWEELNGRLAVFRPPGSLLRRPATWKHNVWTGRRANWSIILTAPESRDWGFEDCRDPRTYKKFEKTKKPKWQDATPS